MGLSKAESELIAQKAREKGLFVMEVFHIFNLIFIMNFRVSGADSSRSTK